MLSALRHVGPIGTRSCGFPIATTSVRWSSSNKNPQFLPFEEAREYVRKLGLVNSFEWKAYSRTERPNFIPSNPSRTYKGQYINYADWMGYSHCPRLGRSARFLPFEEAREYVRKFGFTSRKQWKQYSKTDRPTFIPGNPAQVYTTEWTRYADWCGYEVVPSWSRKVFLENMPQKSVRAPDKSINALQTFADKVSSLSAGRMKIVHLPREMRGSILLKIDESVDGDTNDQWIRLHIRSAGPNAAGTHSFAHIPSVGQDGLILIKVDTAEMYLIRGSEVRVKMIHLRPTSYKYSKFRIGSDEHFLTTLKDWYAELPKQSLRDWMEETVCPLRLSQWGLLFQAENLLDRCNLNLQFPLCRDKISNVLLGNYQVYHRMLCKRRIGCGYEFHLSERRAAGQANYPLDFDCDIDCVMASFHLDGILQGFFFFPKSCSALKEFFNNDGNVGIQCITIYPPNISPAPSTRFAEKKQQETSRYYIDVSDPENLPLAEAKLQEIVAEIGAFKESQSVVSGQEQGSVLSDRS